MTRDRRERTRQALLRLCHRGLDVPAFAHAATETLQGLVGFDGCCWLTLDPATLLPTSHIAINSLKPEDVVRLAHNEYAEEDLNRLADLARLRPPSATLRHSSGGDPDRSPRYRGILRPNDFEDELRAALVDSGGCWGGMAMYRRRERGNFGLEDAEAVGKLSPVLAEGLRRALLVGSAGKGNTQDAPGVVVLDKRGRVEMITPQARRWMKELIVNSAPGDAVPNVIHAVAYRAQLAAAGTEGGLDGIAQARVPTASGQWLVLHGSLLGELKDRRIAIIIELARPPQLAPLIVRAYGLTDREVEVIQLVMQGHSTSEISQRLHLSPYTVQDHLKAIFEKAGVHSRRELTAQVFFRHYVPRLQAGAPLGSDGWFAQE